MVLCRSATHRKGGSVRASILPGSGLAASRSIDRRRHSCLLLWSSRCVQLPPVRPLSLVSSVGPTILSSQAAFRGGLGRSVCSCRPRRAGTVGAGVDTTLRSECERYFSTTLRPEGGGGGYIQETRVVAIHGLPPHFCGGRGGGERQCALLLVSSSLCYALPPPYVRTYVCRLLLLLNWGGRRRETPPLSS